MSRHLNLDPRIVIAAPSFGSNISRMAAKIRYQVELIKIRRFVFEQDHFVLVDKISQSTGPKIGPTAIMGIYDRVFYESVPHGKEAVDGFIKTKSLLDELSERRNWKLDSKFNKHSAGFKYGNKLCFGIWWDSTHIWSIFVKVPREVSDSFQADGWYYNGYDESWQQGYYRPETPETPNVEALVPLLQQAYTSISRLR